MPVEAGAMLQVNVRAAAVKHPLLSRAERIFRGCRTGNGYQRQITGIVSGFVFYAIADHRTGTLLPGEESQRVAAQQIHAQAEMQPVMSMIVAPRQLAESLERQLRY